MTAVLVTGRPLVLPPDVLARTPAVDMAGLPGTEGQGGADIVFVTHVPTGKLPRTWMKTVAQLPMNTGDSAHDPLFPCGFGLTYAGVSR